MSQIHFTKAIRRTGQIGIQTHLSLLNILPNHNYENNKKLTNQAENSSANRSFYFLFSLTLQLKYLLFL